MKNRRQRSNNIWVISKWWWSEKCVLIHASHCITRVASQNHMMLVLIRPLHSQSAAARLLYLCNFTIYFERAHQNLSLTSDATAAATAAAAKGIKMETFINFEMRQCGEMPHVDQKLNSFV